MKNNQQKSDSGDMDTDFIANLSRKEQVLASITIIMGFTGLISIISVLILRAFDLLSLGWSAVFGLIAILLMVAGFGVSDIFIAMTKFRSERSLEKTSDVLAKH